MKRKILLFMCVFMLLFMFAGCSSGKDKLSADAFTKIAKEHEFVVTDITPQLKDNTMVTTALQAEYDALAWAEYYEFANQKDAKGVYEATMPEIKKSFKKDSEPEITKEETDAFSCYEIKTADRYEYICLIENTMLYIQAFDSEYMEVTSALVDALGH